ncbi:MAG: hypothetical protein IT355_02345 [Gemmatimonadaceae bacterium]|nr:hypothetical protein [Gemmatimonadaceae bacterium]
MSGAPLWESDDERAWRRALESYPQVIAAQGVPKLPALDTWYREELPLVFTDRRLPFVTLAELVQVTEWKMYRGVWRAPNLVRVKANDPDLVVETMVRAMSHCPQPTKPVGEIAKLDGVGPATASAVLAALMPHVYPFFDELVAAQVPELGVVKWTLGYYAQYAEQLRTRATALGDGWTAAMVERALWAVVGGKTGTR